MSVNEHEHVEETEERRRRGAGWLRFGIAGLAILGIGGALTTALWQQQAIFEADAQAHDLKLEAAIERSGGNWDWKPTVGGTVTLVIDDTELKDIMPTNDPIEIDVAVKNAGAQELKVTLELAKEGLLFVPANGMTPPTVDVTPASEITLLPAGEETITIEVTPGAGLDPWFQGRDGSLTLTATAEAL